ncbi:amidase [Paenibacillus hexagrammi]|uniref:Amidase n=1 Tax=Paenibacillus hexagrammi TaxID=2908839 RepID=A0ABY3SBQ5_9BACL|nr:amidase family protein [Paenibacillus sp. YPD9-1]UJF31429.1 amidase [Paenibacillus sp. YPD9-1]
MLITNDRKELLQMGAVEMAKGIREGYFTSQELVEAHIERIMEINPVLHAVAIPLFEEARLAAKRADLQAAKGGELGPLHGVPVTVKESLDVAGTPSTWGLPHRQGKLSQADDPGVALLKQAGAIVIGKSNIMQLLMGCESVNPLYGRVRNPWRPEERSSGGSSGGEAAIIAAGGSPLGLGTDVGGSIRTPSHFCGIHGLKPTPGRVPSGKPEGIVHVLPEAAMMASTGPMARRVEDLVLAMEILSTPEYLKQSPIRPSSSLSIQGLHVGFYTTDGILAPSSALQRTVREAADALAQCGAIVKEFVLPEPEFALHQFYSLMSAGGAAGIERSLNGDEMSAQLAGVHRSFGLTKGKKRFVSGILRLLGQKIVGHHIVPYLGAKTEDERHELVRQQELYRQRFLKEMERQQVDVLISPPFLTPSIQHDQSLQMSYEGSYALMYNYLQMPAGIVSTTRVRMDEVAARLRSSDKTVQAANKVDEHSAGLPVGVQVAAPPWREDLVLTVMACLEEQFMQTEEYPVGKLGHDGDSKLFI